CGRWWSATAPASAVAALGPARAPSARGSPSDPPLLDDQRPRHRGAVHVALVVVAALGQRPELEGLLGEAGEARPLKVGPLALGAVIDRQVVLDAGVQVADRDRERAAGGHGQT